MDRIYRFLWKFLLILFVTHSIMGCSKVSQSNFEKIKPDMTMQEVIAILGEPTSSDSINIAGISGTSAIWQDKNAEIDIQFLNNRVTIKVFSTPNDKKSTKTADTN